MVATSKSSLRLLHRRILASPTAEMLTMKQQNKNKSENAQTILYKKLKTEKMLFSTTKIHHMVWPEESTTRDVCLLWCQCQR